MGVILGKSVLDVVHMRTPHTHGGDSVSKLKLVSRPPVLPIHMGVIPFAVRDLCICCSTPHTHRGDSFVMGFVKGIRGYSP